MTCLILLALLGLVGAMRPRPPTIFPPYTLPTRPPTSPSENCYDLCQGAGIDYETCDKFCRTTTPAPSTTPSTAGPPSRPTNPPPDPSVVCDICRQFINETTICASFCQGITTEPTDLTTIEPPTTPSTPKPNICKWCRENINNVLCDLICGTLTTPPPEPTPEPDCYDKCLADGHPERVCRISCPEPTSTTPGTSLPPDVDEECYDQCRDRSNPREVCINFCTPIPPGPSSTPPTPGNNSTDCYTSCVANGVSEGFCYLKCYGFPTDSPSSQPTSPPGNGNDPSEDCFKRCVAAGNDEWLCQIHCEDSSTPIPSTTEVPTEQPFPINWTCHDQCRQLGTPSQFCDIVCSFGPADAPSTPSPPDNKTIEQILCYFGCLIEMRPEECEERCNVTDTENTPPSTTGTPTSSTEEPSDTVCDFCRQNPAFPGPLCDKICEIMEGTSSPTATPMPEPTGTTPDFCQTCRENMQPPWVCDVLCPETLPPNASCLEFCLWAGVSLEKCMLDCEPTTTPSTTTTELTTTPTTAVTSPAPLCTHDKLFYQCFYYCIKIGGNDTQCEIDCCPADSTTSTTAPTPIPTSLPAPSGDIPPRNASCFRNCVTINNEIPACTEQCFNSTMACTICFWLAPSSDGYKCNRICNPPTPRPPQPQDPMDCFVWCTAGGGGVKECQKLCNCSISTASPGNGTTPMPSTLKPTDCYTQCLWIHTDPKKCKELCFPPTPRPTTPVTPGGGPELTCRDHCWIPGSGPRDHCFKECLSPKCYQDCKQKGKEHYQCLGYCIPPDTYGCNGKCYEMIGDREDCLHHCSSGGPVPTTPAPNACYEVCRIPGKGYGGPLCDHICRDPTCYNQCIESGERASLCLDHCYTQSPPTATPPMTTPAPSLCYKECVNHGNHPDQCTYYCKYQVCLDDCRQLPDPRKLCPYLCRDIHGEVIDFMPAIY